MNLANATKNLGTQNLMSRNSVRTQRRRHLPVVSICVKLMFAILYEEDSYSLLNLLLFLECRSQESKPQV